LLLQVALGLHEAVSSPAFDALVAEHLDKGQHIKDYSIWKLIQNFTGAIGALIGAVIVKHYGFDIMFFLMAGLAMLSAVILYMGMMKKNLEVITENECY
jgi:MFS family permease